MRKIFYALTPKPCLEEEAAWEAAWDAWYKVEKILVKLNNDIMEAEARFQEIITEKVKNILAKSTFFIFRMEKTNKEILENQQSLDKINKNLDPNSYYNLISTKKILENMKNAETIIYKSFDKTDAWFSKEADNQLNIKRKKSKEQEIQKEVIKPLLTRRQDALSKFNTCLINRPPRKLLNLNLNSSFKEIKQKIKTINRKLISLDSKLINLNHGILSLNILNINKNLSDQKIKFTKELIVKLDNLKPSFDVIYKKAQNDLSSYKEERKTFISKIKTSEQKIKTIPDKKKKLKAKISNLIKKFAKPPVIQN